MTYPAHEPRCRGRESDPECFRCERFIAGVETLLKARGDIRVVNEVPWIYAPVEKPCPMRMEKKP